MIKTASAVACAFVLGTAASSAVIATPNPHRGASVHRVLTSAHQVTTTTTSSSSSSSYSYSCVGAAALAAPAGTCRPQSSGPTKPTIANATNDKSNAYPLHGRPDCESHSPTFPQVVCGFDKNSAKIKIALVGNSHAAEWLPALQRQADYRGWHVTTFLASSCAFANLRQHWPRSIQTACLHWVRTVAARLAKSSYNLIVMSDKISQGAEGTTTLQQSYKPYYAGYWSVLNVLHKAHKRVLVLHDTPAPGKLIPQCLHSHPNDYAACNGARSQWAPNDPAVPAAKSFKDKRILAADLTDRICQPSRCQAVVGGDIVYYDGSHLTATYSRSLASYLGIWLFHALETP